MRDVELGNRTLTTNEASRTRLALGRILLHWRLTVTEWYVVFGNLVRFRPARRLNGRDAGPTELRPLAQRRNSPAAPPVN